MTQSNSAKLASFDEFLAAGGFRSYLAGLTLSTAGSSASFGVAAGVAMDSTNAKLMSLASAITKTTGAFVAGTGNGALDTGTIAASTWYHVYLIENPTTGAVDALLSTGATTPNLLPTGFTLFRRIGSMKTDGSSHWVKFSHLGDEFLWDTMVADAASATFTGGTASLVILSTPLGIQTQAIVFLDMGVSTTTFGYISSPDQADNAASVSNFNAIATPTGTNAIFNGNIRTDTSSRIRVRTDVTVSGGGFVFTRGWVDRRGRDN